MGRGELIEEGNSVGSIQLKGAGFCKPDYEKPKNQVRGSELHELNHMQEWAQRLGAKAFSQGLCARRKGEKFQESQWG